MGVILTSPPAFANQASAPHVYGGDPHVFPLIGWYPQVLPMYMGVIQISAHPVDVSSSAPHVYGGDPCKVLTYGKGTLCSPCIWG